MNARRRRALLTALRPLLEPGERVEVTTVVNLSTVSVGRTAMFAVASSVLSAGSMAVIPAPVPMYLTMTDRRILVHRADPVFAKPVEHTLTLSRAGLVRSEVRERILNSSFVVSSPEGGTGLRIVFPLLGRKERDAVAAALPLAA